MGAPRRLLTINNSTWPCRRNGCPKATGVQENVAQRALRRQSPPSPFTRQYDLLWRLTNPIINRLSDDIGLVASISAGSAAPTQSEGTDSIRRLAAQCLGWAREEHSGSRRPLDRRAFPGDRGGRDCAHPLACAGCASAALAGGVRPQAPGGSGPGSARAQRMQRTSSNEARRWARPRA
jgi:hypothetical protein